MSENNPMELVVAAQSQGMTTWTDEKKKDFIKTFDDRIIVSQYILRESARKILDIAHKKQYVSTKHVYSLQGQISLNWRKERIVNSIRDLDELNNIALEKANTVIDQLPSLIKAVTIIDPVTADNMKERDKLKIKAQEITDLLSVVLEKIHTKELDQDMTLRQLHELIDDKKKKEKKYTTQLDDIAEKILELDTLINKALYKGLPGLSDAVIDVVKTYLEQATAMEAMGRRVSEKVMFGDSDAAIELLKHFENDEVTVSEDVKNKFAIAMEKLNLTKKAISAKKKKNE